MLRSRALFAGLTNNPALGSRFCGNGDLLTFALKCREEKDGKRGGKGRILTAAGRQQLQATLREVRCRAG